MWCRAAFAVNIPYPPRFFMCSSLSCLFDSHLYIPAKFVLLLALFLRPLLHTTPGRRSPESTYGTVVFRNVTCTIVMLVTYAVGTAAVVFALLHLSSADQVQVVIYCQRAEFSTFLGFPATS